MFVANIILGFVLVSTLTSKVYSTEPNVTDKNCGGFAFEMLVTKLEYLQHTLSEMDAAMKHTEKTLFQAINQIGQTLDQKLSHQENLTQGLLTVINQQSQTMVNNLTTMQNHFNHMFSNHSWSINELMWNEIRMLASKNDVPRSKIDSGEHPQAVTFRSCKENPSQLSGKYIIQSTEADEPSLGYCEQTAFAGGWLVFQHRYDGSVGFYRNWTEYRDGFGSIDGEFWLGLEQLHRLTSARVYELLVELKDFSGNYMYARYDEFAIGSEAQQYQLTKLGSYSGTAGDSLIYHKDAKFSTRDRDNDDNQGGNCASRCSGAWWYKNCADSNLNGVYMRENGAKAMSWYHYRLSRFGLAYSRLMIRERQQINKRNG
ncbi:fibrinogen-like protein A [Anopheles arabiensis]|uniref:fibrinogen-like protein A n=1 Tax=Anopheles arabiensis TaxID=7173 RepID=UPI001AADBF23|nr:fibrinogen-like protein A [Anopheles arabiensis]